MSKWYIPSSSPTAADFFGFCRYEAVQPTKVWPRAFGSEAKREFISLTSRNIDSPAHTYFRPVISKPEFYP